MWKIIVHLSMIGFLKCLLALGISMTLSYLCFTPVAWLWRSRITSSTCSSLIPVQAGTQGACLPSAQGWQWKLHGARFETKGYEWDLRSAYVFTKRQHYLCIYVAVYLTHEQVKFITPKRVPGLVLRIFHSVFSVLLPDFSFYTPQVFLFGKAMLRGIVWFV